MLLCGPVSFHIHSPGCTPSPATAMRKVDNTRTTEIELEASVTQGSGVKYNHYSELDFVEYSVRFPSI